jgi:hypothetical protein
MFSCDVTQHVTGYTVLIWKKLRVFHGVPRFFFFFFFCAVYLSGDS